jgi:hypothetical protein
MVEITIDTKKDSKQEIKRVIDFLEKLISQENSEIEEGVFNIFDSQAEEKTEKADKKDSNIKPILY